MTEFMRAMLLDKTGNPLRQAQVHRPVCGEDQVLLKIRACGVCRTDLHIIDGELSPGKLPLIPGMKSSELWSKNVE